jgi:hypothetical protein
MPQPTSTQPPYQQWYLHPRYPQPVVPFLVEAALNSGELR